MDHSAAISTNSLEDLVAREQTLSVPRRERHTSLFKVTLDLLFHVRCQTIFICVLAGCADSELIPWDMCAPITRWPKLELAVTTEEENEVLCFIAESPASECSCLGRFEYS